MLVLEEPEPRAWERFLGGDRGASAGHAVLARWARAIGLGVRPEGSAEPVVVAARDVRRRRERFGAAWPDAEQVLEGLERELASQGFVALVTDPDAIVLGRRGGGGFLAEADRVRLIEGARWHEDARGTNAIGTALVERTPVAVLGRAHLERTNHELVCYAAPIRDAMGEAIGVLDLTGHLRAASPMAGLAAIAAARAIEAGLRDHAFDALSPAAMRAIERALARCDVPAVLIERPGAVRAHNEKARTVLGARVGASASRVLGAEWSALERGGGLDVRVARGALRIEVEPVLDPAGRALALLAFALPALPAPKREETPGAFDALVGDDPALIATRERAARFAKSKLPVLIVAETGTGKELLARAIHAASDRARGPFVAVNCGALSPALLESELFGYAPGAFTGARPSGSGGKLAEAAGGTLFLDEVGEMPPALQTALLRVLEDGGYQRVGEHTTRHADFRVVAATCRELDQAVTSGAFRRDLYYRLRGVELSLPVLRARTDVRLLAKALVVRVAREEGREVPVLGEAALEALAAHDWPGNVRELRNAIAHGVVLADGGVIEPDHLPIPLPAAQTIELEDEDVPLDLELSLEAGGTLAQSAARAVERALEEARGNLSETARRLGVARSTLYRMLDKYGLATKAKKRRRDLGRSSSD
ncbi:sigma-54-dependent Fis family transcriptional regulator [Sandaracinus amylolyticus]|uniref:sigma-54-dependent Fis family transcriptional regulator n=1 Tax=Sandaracinus amylolyticus TaxID=927083 RepID=UPI001F34F76D|nr:sigma 54-interacting transcriptional regulator [Sandaracinus amylolyticus]UJR86541.1 Hypothetical protein I5071_86360 [Sandaracinus amylolyticus]